MGKIFGEFAVFKHLVKTVWQISGSANRLLIVSTNLDGFSLANHKWFSKLDKLSHYTVDGNTNDNSDSTLDFEDELVIMISSDHK